MRLNFWNWIHLTAPYFFAILYYRFSEENFLVGLGFSLILVFIFSMAPHMDREVKTGRSFNSKYGKFDEYKTKHGELIENAKIYINLLHIVTLIALIIYGFSISMNSDSSANDKEEDAMTTVEPEYNEKNNLNTSTYQTPSESNDSISNNYDVVSDENLESSEANNEISLGGYYHGGIIFHLDYDGKHGLIRTNTIENENGFTWDMAKQSSEEYSNDGFTNWYLPESEELEMIFANKNDNLLKDGKYWCLLDGSKNGNFLGYTSSDNSFWTASRDYRVPMAIFISKF